MWHQLAQFNLARIRAPLDDARMTEYVAAIPVINGLGEMSDGFVWRSSESGDNAEVLPTLTVWESPDALRAFVYQSGHVEVMKRREEWLAPFGGPSLALWWVPAGHRPSLAEAEARLEHLRQHGPTPVAFTFNPVFLEPASPEDSAGEVPDWSYEGREFGLVENTSNGDNRPGVRFIYRQAGNHVWATYEGGEVKFGSLVARVLPGGELDMRYQHWGPGGVRTGKCRSTPEWLGDGRLRLHEEWQWTNGDGSAGRGVIEERR
jgi:hypothetical protein